LDSIDTEAVTWQYPLLNASTIDALKSRGFTVYAWTVDDIEIANRLVDDGVDGIISNRAEMFSQLYSDTALG
jgi:glycerophosphoryl diester phosphodiesterase